MVRKWAQEEFPGGLVVRDPALSLLQLGSLQWHGFDPWSRNFHTLQVQPKERERGHRKRVCKSEVALYMGVWEGGQERAV